MQVEVKQHLALKHHKGKYLSWDEKNFPLTPKVSEARRFYSTDHLQEFLNNSYYRPTMYGMENTEFQVVTVEVTYKELTEDVQQVGIDN